MKIADKKLNKDVTILVNSCDKYEDAWEPFFRLLKIHWPECENYRIILNTETKVYNCDFLNFETICGGTNISWSKRLKKCLKKIDSEVVLFLMEDFFLKSKFNDGAFLNVVDTMLQDKSIGYISVQHNNNKVYKDGSLVECPLVSRDELLKNYRLALVSALWNKNYFLKVIRNHESPWEFEQYAGIRSKRYPERLLDVNNNKDCCECYYDYDIAWEKGIGITHGQWLPKNKELFEQYGIEVNFDNLGINYELYEEALKASQNPQESSENCSCSKPVQPYKFDLIEALYNIKKQLKKEKIIKTIRRIRSLI